MSVIAMPTPIHDFRAEGDEDLLAWMAMNSDEPAYAEAACEEFYKRNLNYVYGVVRNAQVELIGDAIVEDIVVGTFGRVFAKASTYCSCGAPNAKGKRHNVLAWVGTIAQNLIADYLRDENTRLQLVDDWQLVEPRIVPRDDGPLSQEARWAGEALGELQERERTILLATLQHYNVNATNQRLPNGVAEDLARTYETKPENIRQIRKRALAKIKAYVEQARMKLPNRSQA